jgi:hypothetical protein
VLGVVAVEVRDLAVEQEVVYAEDQIWRMMKI